MADQERRQRKKGTFSSLRLPVIRKYIFPSTRMKMIWVGAIAGALVLLYGVLSMFFQHDKFISNGPLSSSHSTFENDCSKCHFQSASLIGKGSVTNDKCSVCHEKFGDKLGVYTWSAHYVYRSNDLTRNVSHDKEMPCFACHTEHEGREFKIKNVRDDRCLPCHQFTSFNDRHPQFGFIKNNIPDDANLRFPHIKHVVEIKKHEHIEDTERACLYCHTPQSDGKGFEPISFDQHCAACHLKGDDETPLLPVSRGEGSPGVQTLATMRAARGPELVGVKYSSSNEFQEAGGQVIKHPIYHKDPWIMENLRTLRGEMYTDLGITNLLQASSDLPNGDARVLYREALSTLREQAAGLQSRPEPEVQDDLVRIKAVIDNIERELKDPYTPLDKTKFLLGAAEVNPNINFQQYQAVVDSLTSRCQRCHTVTRASIERVQKNQHVLQRAEFNHRAHIFQKRCLDCHTRIPIEQAVNNPGSVDVRNDLATVQNIPGIETCQQCHKSGGASNKCMTCHDMHPNKTQRSNLLQYVQ